MVSVGGKCKEQDSLQAPRKTEQKAHDVSKENHSFLPLADLDLPFKLRPPPHHLRQFVVPLWGRVEEEMDKSGPEGEKRAGVNSVSQTTIPLWG